MDYRKSLDRYKKTDVETTRKIDLIIMCYEKMIQFLTQSKAYYEKNEIEEEAEMVEKVLAIISELRRSLSFEKGGQIAKNLDAIYDYLNRRLLQWKIQRDLRIFDEALCIMCELKGAWEGIASEKENRLNMTPDPSSIITNTAQISV